MSRNLILTDLWLAKEAAHQLLYWLDPSRATRYELKDDDELPTAAISVPLPVHWSTPSQDQFDVLREQIALSVQPLAERCHDARTFYRLKPVLTCGTTSVVVSDEHIGISLRCTIDYRHDSSVATFDVAYA